MNRPNSPTIRSRLIDGLDRLNLAYPDLPLVPLNGKKQPIGDNWQNQPNHPSQLKKAITDGGVELSVKGKTKKIQPQGFGVITGRTVSVQGQSYYLMALDQDGAAAAQKIQELSGGEPLPKTVAFTSGRPGRCQYLFLVPEDYKNAIRTKKVKTGCRGNDGKEELLEFRWKNLQSVLPPSVHPTTGEYRWCPGCAIDEIAIAPAPDWVIAQMSKTVESVPINPSVKRPVAVSALDFFTPAQLPRHPDQIQIPVTAEVPLLSCCRREVRDAVASGVQKGSGRNDTAISVGLELVAVEGYLGEIGQPITDSARQLFREYCQRSGMTEREEEERWRWCSSKNPTPSCSQSGIEACIRGWYWQEFVKPSQKQLAQRDRSPALATPTKLDENLEGDFLMLPEKDKTDAVQIGEDLQEIPGDTAVTVLRLTDKILQEIKKRLRHNNQLKIDLDKPTSIAISVDGKLAYSGLEDGKPSLNEISPKDLQLVAQALNLTEGQSLSESCHISISLNGQKVLKVSHGLVQLNKLSPQIAPTRQETEPLVADSLDQQVNQKETTEPNRDYQVIKDSPPTPVTLISSNIPRQSQQDRPAIQLSPADRDKLSQQGFEPQAIEEQANQQWAQNSQSDRSLSNYMPLIVVATQKEQVAQEQKSERTPSRISKLLNFIASAPEKLTSVVKTGLDKIKNAFSANNSHSFAQLQSPNRAKESRSQDLNNIAALVTAKKALAHLGATLSDGTQVFTGEKYQFVASNGSLSVEARGRGTILDWDASSGTLKGNLSPLDIKVFRGFDAALSTEKAPVATVERQTSDRTNKKDGMEIG